MKMLGIRLDPKLVDRLKLRALREHTSVRALVEEAVENLLKQPRKEESK